MSELELLKIEATELGIQHSPNIGVETLREKIQAAKELQTNEPKEKEEESSYKTDGKLRNSLIKEITKLKRVNITCINPNKKEYKGQFFSFSNSAIGTITRMVPFDIDTHVEEGILRLIKSRKFARVNMVKNSDGVPYPERKLVREFNISELESLTNEELKDLASDQAKRGAIDK